MRKSVHHPIEENKPSPLDSIQRLYASRRADSQDVFADEIPQSISDYPLSFILQRSESGFLLSDEQSRFTWANDSFLKECNQLFPHIEFVGNSYIELLDSLSDQLQSPEIVMRDINDFVYKGQEKIAYDIKFINGTTITLTYIPILEGTVTNGAIWSFINLSKRKSIAEKTKINEEKFRVILTNLGIGFCEIDLNGNITKVYDGFCKLTGYKREELIGRNITDMFVPGEMRELAVAMRKERMKQGTNPVSYEMEIITKDGSHKWALTSSTNLFDNEGNIVGGIDVHMDITSQKKLQQELEKAKKASEESRMALQQFLASMSHEIRTPLNAIIGMSHLLSDTKLTREQKEYTHILKNSSNILLSLISDILDFSKIESGNMEVQSREFDLIDLVRSLTNTFQFKMKRKAVKVSFIPDKNISNYLIGDDILLNQVLLNLLGNSEKFTSKGTISVSVAIIKREEDTRKVWIEFRVNDTGIGIEKDKLQFIFQDFKQANNDISAKFGGTGLGLSISKKLIELQGGSISVESRVGEGSCFTFTLPFYDTGKIIDHTISKIDPVVSANMQLFSDAHVLIVEDNPMNLSYITSLLEKFDVSFDVATNGFDALEIIRQQPFHMILMDIKIPGIEGLEVSSIVRNEDNPNAATPIVLITAAALQSTVNAARENGINDLLPKPFTPEQLLNILRKYIADDDQEAQTGLITELEEKMYSFNPRLDVNYLIGLYENNIEYATGLFAIFLENIQQDWTEIKAIAEGDDYAALYQVVHKIKPNFSMVGLTWITRSMEQLEKCIKENRDLESIPAYINKADTELKIYLPVVEEEYQNLLAYQSVIM
jgi:PAS domain S-box-containing protein